MMRMIRQVEDAASDLGDRHRRLWEARKQGYRVMQGLHSPADQPLLYGRAWVTTALALRHPQWGPLASPLWARL